jgi:hypothetical protein
MVGFPQVMRVAVTCVLCSGQWLEGDMTHGIATFLTGMHPGLSLRNYPYLVNPYAHLPYHTANRAITWQRGCSGHLQQVVDCRSMCPTAVMNTIPCAMLKLQPLHLFSVAG